MKDLVSIHCSRLRSSNVERSTNKEREMMQVSKIISICLLAVPRKLYGVEQERASRTKSESRSVISDYMRPHGL